MKTLLRWSLLLCALNACGDNLPAPEPDANAYTWGDMSHEIGALFCGALETCGVQFDEHALQVCTEHVAWHSCVPDGTCDVPIDEELAREELLACKKVLVKLDTTMPACFELAFFGIMPDECQALLDQKPPKPEEDE